MKKLFSSLLLVTIIAFSTVTCFADEGNTQIKADSRIIVESGVRNADNPQARTLEWVGGNEAEGGMWYYGTDLFSVFSKLKTTKWNNRTSVQPGEGAEYYTSGFVGVGKKADISTGKAIFGGNRAFYDLSET